MAVFRMKSQIDEKIALLLERYRKEARRKKEPTVNTGVGSPAHVELRDWLYARRNDVIDYDTLAASLWSAARATRRLPNSDLDQGNLFERDYSDCMLAQRLDECESVFFGDAGPRQMQRYYNVELQQFSNQATAWTKKAGWITEWLLKFDENPECKTTTDLRKKKLAEEGDKDKIG